MKWMRRAEKIGKKDKKLEVEKVIESLNIFDPDIPYAYSDSLFEIDSLIIFKGFLKGIFFIEEISNVGEEWHKVLARHIFSPSIPPNLWIGESDSINELKNHIGGCITSENFFKGKIRNKMVNKCLLEQASEMVNLLFYSIIFLSERFLKWILADFHSIFGGFEKKFDDILNISKFMSMLDKSLCLKSHEFSKRIECIIGVLQKAEILILLPQLGFKEYRVKAIAKSIDILMKFIKDKENKKLIVATNEYLIKSSMDELQLLEKELREVLEKAGVKLEFQDINCLLKELKRKSREKTVFILMQDWGKKFLKSIIDEKFTLIIIPETYYLYRESESGRLMSTVGRFLSDISKRSKEEISKIFALKFSMVMGRDDQMGS